MESAESLAYASGVLKSGVVHMPLVPTGLLPRAVL